MTILTLEQLLELHALVVDETGGSLGLRDLGRLEAAIASQTQNIFGEELYSDVFDKAAAIIRGIIADHSFIDGNKRTAILAGLVFLDINDISFNARPKEIEVFAVKIATKRLDVPAIAKWLNKHTEHPGL